MLAQQNVETLNEAGVRKIVATCPHCFNTLANEYPQLGGNYEVVHHTQLLARLVAEGKLTPVTPIEEKITYHDPCFLGRHNRVFTPPREIMEQVPGVQAQEMHRCKERGFCCGAGGARMWMEERIGKRINIERIDEALGTDPDTISTGCPFCLVMLGDAVAAKKSSGEAKESLEVVDVAQLLVRSVQVPAAVGPAAGTPAEPQPAPTGPARLAATRRPTGRPGPRRPGTGGQAQMDSRRAESFSDGVFAVAITVLVFNLLPIADKTVTRRRHRPDFHALWTLHWPAYLAYVVSFLTIGIMWLNHHAMLSRGGEGEPGGAGAEPVPADGRRRDSVPDRAGRRPPRPGAAAGRSRPRQLRPGHDRDLDRVRVYLDLPCRASGRAGRPPPGGPAAPVDVRFTAGSGGYVAGTLVAVWSPGRGADHLRPARGVLPVRPPAVGGDRGTTTPSRPSADDPHRQPDADLGALARPGFQRGLPAVRGGDGLHDRQAQAAAAGC